MIYACGVSEPESPAVIILLSTDRSLSAFLSEVSEHD